MNNYPLYRKIKGKVEQAMSEAMTNRDAVKMDLAVGKAIGLDVYIGPNMGGKDRCWKREGARSPVPFSPTESDADAMAVLRRCIEHVGGYGLKVFYTRNQWVIQASTNCIYNVTAPTLPLAICLFSLKIFP